MANMRDSDTSLWLHNKLGTSNDSWTGGSICSQLNAEVLRNIKDCFPDLQTQVKLKLLLSFFHIPRRNIDEWRSDLDQIVEVAVGDSDLWVSMIAEALKTFPATGSLNTEIADLDEVRPIFTNLVNDLRQLVKKQAESVMLPMECHYLNKQALISVVGQQPAPTKHFMLKKKPKSVVLRSDLLQKSSDAASNVKKSSAPVIPVRSRGMPRKMTDTTPLKGIPSRHPGSSFRSSLLTASLNHRPPISRPPAGRKEGGVKLLDIADQPLGYAAAKKRKRMQELEDARKNAEMAPPPTTTAATTTASTTSVTPDYAAGLTTPAYAPTTPQTNTTASSTTPVIAHTPVTAAASPVVTPKSPIQQTATPTVASSPSQIIRPVQAIISTTQTVTTVPASSPIVITNRPVQQVTQIRIQPQPTTNSLQRRGLALTREQMLEAQDMFRTANKVTRPEKALILGFMAGSRDNPCPHLGNIVTIKLSEDQENVLQPDDTYLTMLVETHFQMNYNNGEWKRIKKYRHLENVVEQIPQNTQTAALV